MKSAFLKFVDKAVVLSCVGIAACSAVMAAQPHTELALKRVTLSSSGVAYYEYEASVELSTLVAESVYRVVHNFSIKNTQNQTQTVMVEIPRYAGYSLSAASGKVLGEAQGRWRVGLPAPASSALSHEVVAEFATPVRQSLQNLSIFQLQEYLRIAKDEKAQNFTSATPIASTKLKTESLPCSMRVMKPALSGTKLILS